MIILLKRVAVVIAALLVACGAAAFVITFAILMEWRDLVGGAHTGTGWLMVGFFGLVVSIKAMLPALLLIVLAEGFRIRSVLFYAVAGGGGLVALYHALGLDASDVLAGRDREIMAGAGIAAGFVYWAIAGRKAGCWRAPEPSAGAPSRAGPRST